MKREWSLEFTDRLASAPDPVWDRVSTMRGVNEELMPLLRMTYPAEAADTNLAQAPTGTFLFHSWILLGGVVPVDRHHLRLTRVDPGRGFVEESESWTQRYWRHERTIEAAPGGCVLTDRLTFRPRLRPMGFLIAWFIRRVFTHRHQRLRERFGRLPSR
jgi:ligand-binding SRPBCC domain-containing protein